MRSGPRASWSDRSTVLTQSERLATTLISPPPLRPRLFDDPGKQPSSLHRRHTPRRLRHVPPPRRHDSGSARQNSSGLVDLARGSAGNKHSDLSRDDQNASAVWPASWCARASRRAGVGVCKSAARVSLPSRAYPLGVPRALAPRLTWDLAPQPRHVHAYGYRSTQTTLRRPGPVRLQAECSKITDRTDRLGSAAKPGSPHRARRSGFRTGAASCAIAPEDQDEPAPTDRMVRNTGVEHDPARRPIAQ